MCGERPAVDETDFTGCLCLLCFKYQQLRIGAAWLLGEVFEVYRWDPHFKKQWYEKIDAHFQSPDRKDQR
jgi:hypothetical protein